MEKLSEKEVADRFREKLGSASSNISVLYRECIRPRSNRLTIEVHIDGTGKSESLRRLMDKQEEAIVEKVPDDKANQLFEKIAAGIDTLIPRSEAAFLPDSKLKSIILKVDGEEAQFFLPLERDDDEEVVKIQRQPAARSIDEAIEEIRQYAEPLIRIGK